MASVTKIKRCDLQLEEEIGIGGFSSVYKAAWRHKEVAAKRLHRIDRHELEVLANLDHPNIVKLYGVVDENFEFLLVMELCKGGSLRSYLNNIRGKPLSVNQFFDWAMQAARPIKYLREKKIVHKDIKSPNYLISGGILKLGDFGSAKIIDTTVSNATMTASYAWMAPELLKDTTLSPNYDIHSYGVVVWELWTTDIPFEGAEPVNIIWRVCNDNERPSIPPNCPEPLADMMRQCWDLDWHNRPTIDHILNQLTAAKLLMQKRLIAGPWVSDTVFGQHGPGELNGAKGIAINASTGDVAAADNLTAQVKVYSNEGEHKFSLDTTQGLIHGEESEPWNVTINSEGSYYVTDRTQYVKVYDAEGGYKDRWIAVSPDNKPSNTDSTVLLGLAMDANGHLLVGEMQHRYISKHRQDGSHIASIRVPMRPDFLAVTSQDTIVVSDQLNNVASLMDHKGQVLHILTPGTEVKYWQPKGVCCHEDIIFICNYDTRHGICCFSLSGEYMGSITIRKCPIDIKFVENKKFMVVHKYKCRVRVYSCETD